MFKQLNMTNKQQQKRENHKVSIIVPVYNAEKYLERCVESILAQSHENWEAILVNDGSSDSSLDILKSYAEKDSRFRVLDKANGGASSARNMGIEALQTDYFCFVDADDSIHPDFLKKTLKAAIVNNCDLVVTGINFKDRKGSMYQAGLVKLVPDMYIKCVHPGPCAKLYKKKLIIQAGLHFFEDMHYAEDYVFTRSYALLVNNYYSIQEPMYHYHYDNDNSLDHRFANNSMPYEQYLYCAEAPWRIFFELLNIKEQINHKKFSEWAYALYNELWRMYYISNQHLFGKDKKNHTEYFKMRHKDFANHISYWKRICAFQRHPRLYNFLRIVYRTLNRIKTKSSFGSYE